MLWKRFFIISLPFEPGAINGRRGKRYQQKPQQKVSKKRERYFSYKSILAIKGVWVRQAFQR
jgi:hypothetical protein